MPRPSKHFLSLVNMPEDSGMSLKKYFYEIVSELNKELYYLKTDTDEGLERHREIMITLHELQRHKPWHWPSIIQLRIAKEPISLDSPIEDEDGVLEGFISTPQQDGSSRRLRHPRKSKLLEEIRKGE